MLNETRNCQNCKKDFSIEPADFDFYKKIDVPPPTFCPECRFIRRMSWRNERMLYRRPCDMCKKNIIAMYPAAAEFPVYCRECWYSDGWDATRYGREYDFRKPFFEQLRGLQRVVPKLALWQRNVINSDFSNMCGECKNVYLSVSVVVNSENVFYSKAVDASKDIFDSYNIKISEGCYQDIDGEKNYNTQYAIQSRNCIDSRYVYDCVNCRNCFMSTSLRNKEYYFRNQQLTKEQYIAEMAKINFGSRATRYDLLKEFNDIQLQSAHRFANVLKSVNTTGNGISNAKNARNCFDVYDVENVKNCYRGFGFKDSMDFDYGLNSELMYEYTTGATQDFNVKFSYSAMTNVRNADYVECCVSGTNLFGCISVRNKSNVILNKAYSEEEFVLLRKKIIAQMNDMPFAGNNGRVYRYGEFFPMELSPFTYNESPAQDFFPLTKDEAVARGYRWKDSESRSHVATIPAESIPDSIIGVTESILTEALGCVHSDCNHGCVKVFRLAPDELAFYKKNIIPLPDLCPNCRIHGRLERVLPPKLWHRQCMKEDCKNEFETPYAPERKEKIYCESCYQQEVV